MTDLAGGSVRGDVDGRDVSSGERAQFGRRFVARVVDGWILGLAGAAALGTSPRVHTVITIGLPPTTSRLPSTAVSVGLTVALSVLYETTFLMACGATPGKRLLGVEVVDARTFRRLRFRQALLRGIVWALALVVPVLIVVLWITALADRRRRGVHDKLARTAPMLLPSPARAPSRRYWRTAGAWLLCLVVCTAIQLSRPGLGHGQGTTGVMSDTVGSSTSSARRAAGHDITIQFTPNRRGPFDLAVTDVTAPPSAPFAVTGIDRNVDGSVTVRLRAERCGAGTLEHLVLHSRLGPLALQRTLALLLPVAAPAC